jgi:hypothetical protein
MHDQPPGHPVQGQGQGYRIVQAETVRARGPGCANRRADPGADRGPVHDETMDLARMRRLGAYRVDDHGERRPGPGLDQPGGLAVADHESHPGRPEIAQLIDDRKTGAVVAPELVADPDHHDRLAAGT